MLLEPTNRRKRYERWGNGVRTDGDWGKAVVICLMLRNR